MKRRLWAALLCLCLLLTAVPYAAMAEGPATTGTVYGLIDDTPLRVRSQPVDGEVIDRLYNDDVVTILATSEDGGWYQVLTPNGVTGWSSATYIRINVPEVPPQIEQPAEGATGTVYNINQSSKLYVRRDPDEDAAVLDKLSNDTVVNVLALSEDGDWYQVLTPNGITGWCKVSYIRINQTYESDEAFEAHLTEQGFPEDYKAALRVLYAHYPNWVFEAAVLPMTFAEAVAAESEVLKNSLNVNDHPEAWLSMEYGAYDWAKNEYVEMDSGGWVTPTPAIIAYYMDPRNFLDFTYIFQFENLLYSDKHTVEGVQAILPSRYDAYAEDLLQASKDANINAYFLAARMTQEGSAIDGTFTGDNGVCYDGYYNFFNIGAYAGSQFGEYHGAQTNGAINAVRQGWDTPYKCLVGGAQFLGRNYIHKGQNTTYYQKFNVAGENLYNHQYMSNINAPTAESKIRANKATHAEMVTGMTFVIPVYQEMPEAPSPKPGETGNNNNFLDSLTVEGFTLTPTFDRYAMEYAVEVQADTTAITITAVANHPEATVTGDGLISLQTGDNLLPVTVTATSGAVRTYTISVFCQAEVPDLPPVPPPPPTPQITGTTYRVGDTVTGVEPQTTVTAFVDTLILLDGTAKIVAADGTTEKTDGVVASGDRMQIFDNDGALCLDLTILIYGDVNGDGKVSTIDLRIIQKHILGVDLMEGLALTAADVNGDGKVSTIDLRMIQKFILGLNDSLQSEKGGAAQ